MAPKRFTYTGDYQAFLIDSKTNVGSKIMNDKVLLSKSGKQRKIHAQNNGHFIPEKNENRVLICIWNLTINFRTGYGYLIPATFDTE